MPNELKQAAQGHTPGPWALEVGEDRCFHKGNRVAITVSGIDSGEPYNVTIAELWPTDGDRDIVDGRLIAAAPAAIAKASAQPAPVKEED